MPLAGLFTSDERDPERFLRRFSELIGIPPPPSPLPAALAQGARTLMVERPPWEAEIPLAALAAAPFPKLVVSGGHSAAFDAVCAALERGLGAEGAALPGAGHAIPRAGGFNELLRDFLRRAG